jgi:hypothetical protein
MSFSQESQIAIRQVLLRNLPVGGETMKKLYNNILEAAGHDQEGEFISIFAAGVVKCYGTNGNDTNPQYEECCESLISWNGKSFCFSANDACDFDVEEDRRSHLGFNVYLTKGHDLRKATIKCFRANIPMETRTIDGEPVQVQVPGALSQVLQRTALEAGKWLLDALKNHWECPGCKAMVIQDSAPRCITSFGLSRTRHCRACVHSFWATPCAKCGSCIGQRQTEYQRWNDANVDLTRCLACKQ